MCTRMKILENKCFFGLYFTWKKKKAYWDESNPMRRKLLYPMKLLPSPKAKANPQMKKEKPPRNSKKICLEFLNYQI